MFATINSFIPGKTVAQAALRFNSFLEYKHEQYSCNLKLYPNLSWIQDYEINHLISAILIFSKEFDSKNKVHVEISSEKLKLEWSPSPNCYFLQISVQFAELFLIN